MGDLIPFRRGRFPAAHIRLTVWIGLLLGLLLFQVMRLWPAPGAAPTPAPLTIQASDPYAEARRSRAILEAQEAAPAEAPASAPASRESRDRPARITGPVRVIDGDTFDYGGTRIRIADIDTPEVRGRCAYETALAGRATQRMSALLAAGPFELQPLPSGRDEDRYGRKLRIVTRGGRSLGDVLVGEGLARTWTGRREPWCV